MSVNRTIDELAGKTIATARIEARPNGDAQFVMHFADGSTATVSAWKREAQALQMNVDLSPNEHPTSGGSARREI